MIDTHALTSTYAMDNIQPLITGDHFAGYAIAGRISAAHDGFREVYEATAPDGRKVALTVFNSSARADAAGADASPDSIAEAAFAVANPATVGLPRCIASGVDAADGRPLAWIAREWIDATKLDELLAEGRKFDSAEALAVVRPLAAAVSAISHATGGGGHYNIAPANVMVRLDENGRPDGAWLVGTTSMGAPAKAPELVGEATLDPLFRAPETIDGRFSAISDMYSLGMLFLAMVAGRPTDDDRALTSDAFREALLPMKWRVRRPVGLVFERATQPDPADRFADIDKFCKFLSRLGRTTRTMQTTPGPADTNEETPGRPRPGRVESVDTPGIHERPKGNGFKDVAGMSDVKAFFRRDFIDIVRNREVAEAYGIHPCNCTLLYGPQGCGKTFIAKRAAEESGLNYRVINPSDLGSSYVHGSQLKIAEAFAAAESNAPTILIFEEFDAIVPKRDADINHSVAGEVNEMLAQLNHCAERGIYVIGTSNRPEMIDPAIMRSGRVEKTIFIPMPDFEARRELFSLELSKRPAAEGIDCEKLASQTENFTCSDITYIVEESARQCFEETIRNGLDKPLPLTLERMISVACTTRPSVSESQRREYLEMKSRLEQRSPAASRKKVGFNLPQ